MPEKEYIEVSKLPNIEVTLSDNGKYLLLPFEHLSDIPRADVAEVKHGEWLKTEAYPHRVYCSLCYKTYVTNEEIIRGRDWRHPAYCTEAEYCPHCGAKMDKKKNLYNMKI